MAGNREGIVASLEGGSAEKALAFAKAFLAEPSETPANTLAVEVAKDAAGAYRDFVEAPVREFSGGAVEALGAEAGGLVHRALARLITMSDTWEERVVEVHRERLARELRDFTRSRRTKEAQGHMRALLNFGANSEARGKQAIYLGAVLGTVLNQQQEAQDLIGWLVKESATLGFGRDTAEQIISMFQQRQAAMMSARSDTIEVEWTRRLSAAETDMRNAMPDKNKMGEPDETVLRDVGDIFRSIARVPLKRGATYFPDLANLFDDYVPGQISGVARVAGVESRSYNMLGFTAKKAVLLTFQDLGRRARFTDAYLEWLVGAIAGDHARRGIEVAGILRTEKALPVLLSTWKDKRFEAIRPTVIEALGDIGSAQGVDVLRTELGESARHSERDPEENRRAMLVLEALGKIVRSPRTSPEVRGGLAHYVVEVIPKGNTRLALKAAKEVVSYKAEELRASDRQWAVRALVHALWMDDDSSALAKGGEREPSILGFRHGIAESLKNLAPVEMSAFLDEVNKFALRYGAAYMAVAEVLEKTGTPAALPTLEAMMSNAMRGDDAGTKYTKEYYWDAGLQQRVELTKDKVVAPLAYAIGKIGGEDGKRILAGFEMQIQAGRMTLPGPDTARFIAQFSGAPGMNRTGDQKPAVELPEADPEEVAKCVKALTGMYLLTGAEKRRIAKITALSQLGQMVPLNALPQVIDQLGDKDALVASAAIATLASYAMPDKPKDHQSAALMKLFDAAASKDPAVRVGISKALKEIGPNRPDVRSHADAFLKSTKDGEARRLIQDIFRNGVPGGIVGGVPVQLAGESGAHQVPASSDEPKGKSALDLKHDYMMARKAWIAGGKKGEPPVPPD